jgi:hypothetical protein
VELVMGNTEKCDFVEVEVMEKKFEPTGYCKALSEKRYLQPA